MWKILELIVIMGIVLVFITEFFIPILMDKPIFGSFRRSKKQANDPVNKTDAGAEAKVDEV